jgi:hypothetical protein
MKNILLLFLLIIHTVAFTQIANYDFSSVDSYVKGLPKSEARSLDVLAKALTINAKNDLEKVRSIYVWLGMNVSYDLKSFKSGRVPDQTPEVILKYRIAVCQGYSELLKRLCILNNIPCEIIPGYSKGYGYKEGKKLKSTDHAWNAVKVDGKWHLIDATWGAGYVDGKENYINMFSNDHFLTDPKKFIMKHLPSDPMWQLTPTEISLSTFEKDTNTVKQAILLSNKTTINYPDTLSNWEKMDSTQKVVNASLRIIRFNPDNSDAWYKMGWFYYTLAWARMDKLNDPEIQRNKSLAVPLAKESVYYLNEALRFMNEIGRRDPFYGSDVKQKKELISQNLKNLQNLIK